MSYSLLKKTLELVDSKSTENEIKDKSRVQSRAKKHIKRLQKHKQKGQTIEQVKKNLSRKSDRTQENLKYLLSLQKNCINKDISQKILQRNNQKLPEPEEEEEKTVFSEEDFKRFEQEYFD